MIKINKNMNKTIRNFLILFTLITLSSCRLMLHYTNYIEENEYGRMHLKNMKFKKSFKPEMANSIDVNSIYFNFYEDTSINYKMYGYWRFFNDGQYATFRSNTDDVNINNFDKAFMVGYYNVIGNKLLIEFPNTSINEPGKRVILKFEILNDGIKQIKPKKYLVYKKIGTDNLLPINPDW